MECINNAFEGVSAFNEMMKGINGKKLVVDASDVDRRFPALPSPAEKLDFILESGNRAQRRAAAKLHRKEVKRERHTVK